MYLLYLCESAFGPAKEIWRTGATQDYVWPSLKSHNETKFICYTFVNLPSGQLKIFGGRGPPRVICGRHYNRTMRLHLFVTPL